MTRKMIVVGIGAMGRAWCSRILPPNIQDGTIEVVAAVDINPDSVNFAQESLGLRPDQCYTDMNKAFDEVKADCCAIITTPATHEAVVDAALAHDLHIISEKPIADTLAASVRIAKKVKAAGKKMGVTMSHRFDQDKTTLRQMLRSGAYGALDYLVCRFTTDCRKWGAWGHFRHDIIDPLMIEGSVHHLDILADMAGAKCDTLYAQTWNPPWGEFAGDSQGLVTMHFENGTRAFYEGAKTNAVSLNGWSNEYIRAECEGGTLVMSNREIERFPYDDTQKNRRSREGEGEKVALLQQPKWANAWLVEQFVHWLDGGEPMETNVEDNLQSVALIFAAIESSRTGMPVKVQEYLQQQLAAETVH
jgi:predicted dehydrogenase